LQPDSTHHAGVLKRLRSFFLLFLSVPQPEESTGFLYWRERILFGMYLAAAVFGMIIVYPTMSFLIRQKHFLLTAIDMLALAWTIAALLMRNTLQFKVRAVAALALLYVIGILILVKLGPISGGFIWLFTFAVSAAVLMGLRSAFVALAFNMVSLMAIYAGILSEAVPWVGILQGDFTVWLIICLNFMLMNSLVATSVGLLLQGLDHSVQEERTTRIDLERQQNELIKMNQQIMAETGERQLAEQELLRQKAYIEQIIENSPVAIAVMSPDGAITRINREFTHLFGYTFDEIADRNISELLAPPGLEAEAHHLRSLTATGERIAVETTRRAKSGEIIEVAVAGSPLFIDNELIAIQAVYANITDRKQAEIEKAQLEAQLLHSQKMEAIGILAGGIAHDFNNILGAIIGFSQMALMDAENGISKPHDLKQILKSAERAKHLVKQILTFSRRITPELSFQQLNQVIRQTVTLLERTLPKMVSIETTLSPDLSPIHADPIQLEQVLMNLGTNAADAMPDGGILSIRTENVLIAAGVSGAFSEIPPGRYVLLTAADTGFGMDEKTLKHIFDPFFTTKGVGKGTGLGLATVYGIVKSHSGHLVCLSEPGKGTSFQIYFPARTTPPVLSVKTDSPAAVQSGKETILLVDDDPSIREFGLELLERYGYRVLLAESGEDALLQFGAHSGEIDMIILDLGMPGMGGYRCLTELLKMDSTVRILIASGYGPVGQAQEALKSGARGFISKPYRIEDMLSAIRKVVDPAGSDI
jgi:PAS domain S-box-containing protein